MVERLPSMLKILGSIPRGAGTMTTSTKQTKKVKGKNFNFQRLSLGEKQKSDLVKLQVKVSRWLNGLELFSLIDSFIHSFKCL